MIKQHTHQTKTGAQPHQATKFDMDTLVGYILLVGVLLSVALILAGLIWHWILNGNLEIVYPIAGMNLFQFISSEIQLLDANLLRPRLLVGLGISVLLLTPFTRVLASVVFFAIAEHNLKYTLFTAFVLTVLTYSLFLR
ncbi:MAG: DUF1634 domain-containing protein [Chloroflexi bacterium]|nr:DUF1634 domain-containing protein [Chloroflexota bacterium]